MSLLGTFARWLIRPAAGLTVALALRFDAYGIFDISRQGWLFADFVLLVILPVTAGRAV